MKRPIESRFLIFFLLFLLSACNANLQGNEVVELPTSNAWIDINFDENYQISVPAYFEEMFDINPKAIVQYGFINKEKDSTKTGYEDEVYVTVMLLPKSQLEPTFADTGRITLNRVNDRTAINLELILEDFEISDASPKPKLINGIAAITNEFSGRLGQYGVFYKMAIFETETDFYQLLTWCMQKHAASHKNEMDSIVHSFENL